MHTLLTGITNASVAGKLRVRPDASSVQFLVPPSVHPRHLAVLAMGPAHAAARGFEGLLNVPLSTLRGVTSLPSQELTASACCATPGAAAAPVQSAREQVAPVYCNKAIVAGVGGISCR